MNSMRPVAILDACVLYPAPIRDFLLHAAALGLFQPKWSQEIQDEWSRNLLQKRPDLHHRQLLNTIKEMNRAFPDANVDGYPLIDKLKLPDPDDHHVVAAAAHCKADFIVTFNRKDFPEKTLSKLQIKPIVPDEFVFYLADIEPIIVLLALQNQVKLLKNPPKSPQEVIAALKKCGLTKAGKWLEIMLPGL